MTIAVRYTDAEQTRGIVRLEDGTEIGTPLPPMDVPLAELVAAFVSGGGRVEPYAMSIDLAAYAKRRRDETEAAGVTVQGVPVASDPDSQTRVGNAYAGMQAAGAPSIEFKATTGYVTLSLDLVRAIGVAFFHHTQACFAAEATVLAGLAAVPPTIATTDEIDAVFAAVPSAF